MSAHVRTLEEAMEGLPSEFAFFAERFRREIQPALQAREGERRRALRLSLLWTVLGWLLPPAAIVLGVWLEAPGYALFGAIVVALVCFPMAMSRTLDLEEDIKKLLVGPVARQFGIDYTMDPGRDYPLSSFVKLALTPSFSSAKLEDRLAGERGGAFFEFAEATLSEMTEETRDGRTYTTLRTLFRGQLLAVKFPRPFSGFTCVWRNKDGFNPSRISPIPGRMKLEDPVFERVFEAWSTDQVEGRAVLTPDFMERLLGLERTFGGKRLRCAFAGGYMFVAVEGRNLLEAGSMRRAMDDPNRVREILLDFAAIFLLVDAMGQRLTPAALRGEKPLPA